MPSRPRVPWILAALVMLIAAVGFACGDDGEDTEPPVASPTEGAAETPTPYAGVIISPDDVLRKDGTATKTGEVEWGFMFELSGGLLQFFGQPTGDGVKLAVKEINEAGGFQVGDTIYTIRLIERDTQSALPRPSQ